MTTDAAPFALQVPITNGVRTVNFFNGRLLSGEDLGREQDAGRALRERLARSVGDGVVEGLTVGVAPGSTVSEPVVTVSAGTALNRDGTALALPADVDVSLARTRDSGPAPPGSVAQRCGSRDFAPCTGLAPGAPFTTSGVYLLTIRPARASVGRAPVSGLGNETAACNTDAVAEGVAFDVLHLDLEPSLLADTAHLRNWLAHRMFGTEDPRRTRLERDPFGSAPTGYGLLDDLRPNCLCDDEVPLATIFWTPGIGIRFVDMWSVRRRVTRGPASAEWPEAIGDRRLAEGEAMLLQFQDQAETLRQAPGRSATSMVASSAFRYLPPAALLPIASGSAPGFSYSSFFSNIPFRGPAVIEGTQLEGLLRKSFRYLPIDLSQGHVIWLYECRENLLIPGTGGGAPQTYIAFASGHIPYRGDARFNLAYWNFASFAEIG